MGNFTHAGESYHQSKISVKELSSVGSVNTLQFSNIKGHHHHRDGRYCKGGKQDRVIEKIHSSFPVSPCN